jgi:hypothetical protein
MTIPVDDRWMELLQAEIGTADGPPSAETLCRVAAAYEAANFPDAALAVLRKAGSFGIENHPVLPALLRGLRAQRHFAELSTAMQTGLAIQDRQADLRRELALALACLSQFPAAQREWASLIRTGCMTQTDWLDCARFVMNCPDAPSLVELGTAIQENPELRTHPLAGYCAVKHLIDRDTAAARRALRKLDPARAGACDAEILLDLAILAWRLHKYTKAEAAARLAAASSSHSTVAQRVLGSIRSFAGDFSHLRTVSMPAARAAAERVSSLALSVQRDAAVWGWLHRQEPAAIESRTLELTPEPDMAVPEELDLVATFSILSENFSPDPFHVLCGVDWSWPHVLMKRHPDRDALHFFIAAQGHKDW